MKGKAMIRTRFTELFGIGYPIGHSLVAGSAR